MSKVINNLGECMMNTGIYNEQDIEIHNNGILVDGTFFGKKEIAETFNELVLVRNFVENINKHSNTSHV